MKRVLGFILEIIGVLFVSLGILSILKVNTAAVSIIGSADGPTSIFLAGKISDNSTAAIIVIGVVLVIAGFVYIIKNRVKN